MHDMIYLNNSYLIMTLGLCLISGKHIYQHWGIKLHFWLHITHKPMVNRSNNTALKNRSYTVLCLCDRRIEIFYFLALNLHLTLLVALQLDICQLLSYINANRTYHIKLKYEILLISKYWRYQIVLHARKKWKHRLRLYYSVLLLLWLPNHHQYPGRTIFSSKA